MSHPAPARAPHRARWTLLTVLLVVGAATVGVRSHHPSSSSAAPPAPTATARPIAQRPVSLPPRVPDAPAGAVGAADGVVPAGTTVFDDNTPAVSKLNPALLAALREAASAAAGDGVTFYVNSGWRSSNYQNQLLREAIAKYGSEKAAERWVATPDTSAHVSGNAVDIGRSNAATWLSRHGSAYGLCQIYRNEMWHFELRPEAIAHGCPDMYADPTQDPRMRQ